HDDVEGPARLYAPDCGEPHHVLGHLLSSRSAEVSLITPSDQFAFTPLPRSVPFRRLVADFGRGYASQMASADITDGRLG
ncbi:hypothetical protein, partial [Escherichia coli]|uniref:hypothetical protein n=1 Tax=Escherichia coli TaxID=562 RepID=UPI001BE4984E